MDSAEVRRSWRRVGTDLERRTSVPIQKFLPGFPMNLKGTAAEPFN
jgi:hypothetical protein